MTARGDLAGLTMTVKRRFSRSNWQIEARWAVGGENQIYYRISPEYAKLWIDFEIKDDVLSSSDGAEG